MENYPAKLFHDAYIYDNQSELDRLWKEVAPQRLIKFFSAQYLEDDTNYALDCIMNKKLWLSSPSRFNDPFDCVANIDYAFEVHKKVQMISENLLPAFVSNQLAVLPGYNEALQEAIEKYIKSLSEIDSHTKAHIYVSCFSEFENLYSICMWSHYANNHEGICVEYDFCDINKFCDFGCLPILYTNNYLLPLEYEGNGVQRILALLYYKAQEWKYEKEWRLATINENIKVPGYKIEFAQPINIYIGCKASEKLNNDLYFFCTRNRIGLYQMKLRPGTYTIYEEKIL